MDEQQPIGDLIAAAGELPDNSPLEAIEAWLGNLRDLTAGCEASRLALVREAAVEKLTGRVRSPASVVDAFLDSRASRQDSTLPRGGGLVLADPEPWHEPIVGATLAASVAETIARYVVLPEHGMETVTLWIIYTHVFDCFEVSPILSITSPVKGCGKTTLLELLGALARRPLPVSNITPAALFRTIEKYAPTLLVDEADTFLHGKDELRGVINSGHRRSLARVIRTVGDDYEPRVFRTWGPKAIAQIGKPPETILDRSIEVSMRRRAPGESSERLRLDRLNELQPLLRQITGWARDAQELLLGSDPVVPDGLRDRQADNWRPLLAVADVVGDGWPERARHAAVALSRVEEDTSAQIQLLADIRSVRENRQGADHIPTADLISKLVGIEDSPWSEWRHGKELTPRQLAQLLRGFEIRSKAVWHAMPGGARKTLRGYHWREFEDAFQRYLPQRNPQEPQEPNKPGTIPALVKRKGVEVLAVSESRGKPRANGVLADLADEAEEKDPT